MPVATGTRGVGYHTLMPQILVRNVHAFVRFAKEVAGATEMFSVTNIADAGQSHYELRIGDSVVMCSGGDRGFTGPEMPVMLHVYVPDTDAAYRRALDAGAESLSPPADQSYGERNAGVKDPAGNQWFFATRAQGMQTPPGHRMVTPYLIRPDAPGLIEFLKSAFDARLEAAYKGPDGKIMHALVWIGDSALEMGDGDRPASAFVLDVPNVDEVYQRALDAGATSVFAPRDEHWGVRMAGVEDAWGNGWTISTELNR